MTPKKKAAWDARKEIMEVMTLYASTAEQKGINLSLEKTYDYPVFVDKRAMQVVLRNLISNALKFTKQGGSITIGLKTVSDRLHITIADNGIGISEKKLSQLFINPETTFGTNNEKGTWLGLALCKEIIELNGGTIKVESELGKGSRFIIALASSEDKEVKFIQV